MNTHATVATGQRWREFDFDQFTFGRTPTDHILLMDYQDGQWEPFRIEPYHLLSLSPMALCFHYGQTVFEGFRAFRLANDSVSIFRLGKHIERLNRSLERMCMPVIPTQSLVDGLDQLIDTERNWLPRDKDVALYIRPVVIATEARLGVKPAAEYLLAVICTPIARYYPQPLKVKVETHYVRAAPGGAGAAKCGGNYGGVLRPTQEALEQGYDQLIWTDACHHEYMEESGTMNVLFYINDTLITPPLGSTILDGITRDSVLQLARANGITVEERPISYKELQQAFEQGQYVEVFGVGTAAIVAPVESITIGAHTFHPVTGDTTVYYRLQQQLEAIRTGKAADPYGWNHQVPVQYESPE